MKVAEDSSIVTGILYQRKGSTDTQLLGGLAISVKLFAGVPITGFTYREENSIENKLVSGSRVTGIVYRHEADVDEQILRSVRIKGVIFQNKGGVQDDVAGESGKVEASREAPLLPEHGPVSGSQIVGIICRDKGTGEEELTTGARVDMKILNGASIVGIIFEGTEGEIIKRLTGSNITGLLFQKQSSHSETLVGDMAIWGFIYQEKDAILERLTNSSKNAVSMAKKVTLYVLLIVGVLGLVLPAVLNEAGFSPLNFLALPSVVVTTLFVLMVAVPATILIYGRYRCSRPNEALY